MTFADRLDHALDRHRAARVALDATVAEQVATIALARDGRLPLDTEKVARDPEPEKPTPTGTERLQP